MRGRNGPERTSILPSAGRLVLKPAEILRDLEEERIPAPMRIILNARHADFQQETGPGIKPGLARHRPTLDDLIIRILHPKRRVLAHGPAHETGPRFQKCCPMLPPNRIVESAVRIRL